ncbi:hypothetical protein Q9R32_00630 [Actinotalea sp. AC32]|nr:hypothetical protein [Actinotalea sp. AC32]
MGRRLTRVLTATAAGAAMALACAAPAQASPPGSGDEHGPRMYHTIASTHASAVAQVVEGCERTDVFVSSAVGHYAAQPGPATKQGLTGVLVRVVDVCAAAGDVAAAAAGGEVVLAEYDGQVKVPLEVDPRLTAASVTATIPEADEPDVTIALAVRWTGTGELEHSTGHSHVLIPGAGVVSSTANDLRRVADAVVTVEVTGPAGTLLVSDEPADDALLERTRSHCIEVPRPGVEEFFPCFGFPG